MPQKRIPLEPESIYHIWTHANGADNLFRTKENYLYFLKKYTHHVHPVVDTFAYCLMPNHLHLMIRVKDENEIFCFYRNKKRDSEINLQGFKDLGGSSRVVSQQFSNLFNAYTKSINKKFNRKGSLFTPNFKRKLIDDENYFMRLIAYIHNNPIHHGFTENLEDWPYSSWHAYLSNRKTNIEKDEVLNWFGSFENFKNIHLEMKYHLHDARLEY